MDNKIIFKPKILWRFLLENKFLPDNGFFDLEPINYVYKEYKEYVNQHNLQMVSLTKNLDSFFNKIYLRDHEYFCYQIKEVEPNEFKKLIDQLYKDYQKNNKYSTPSGFIKKDNTIILIKSMIDIILEDIETSKFRQIYILENETNVFIHKTPLINLYTSSLNQIELFEYLNLISQLIENFKPESKPDIKHPFKDSKTLELFNYIVDNWKYKANQKWADIFNEMNTANYLIPYKADYEMYVRDRFDYKKRFQYDKVKKPNNRNKKDLLKLIDNFSKK